MRVGAGAQAEDYFRKGMPEVFVVAKAEAVAFHDDVASEAGFVVIERDDGLAFGGRENWSSDDEAAGGERFAQSVPVECVDAFLNADGLSSEWIAGLKPGGNI